MCCSESVDRVILNNNPPLLRFSTEIFPLCNIPAFFTIIVMPFTYSITTGIELGLLFYIIANIVNKNYKNVPPMIYIFSLLFIIDFVYKALN